MAFRLGRPEERWDPTLDPVAFRLGRPEERLDPTLDPVAFCLGRPEERLSLIGFDESGTFTCTIATEA